MQTRYHAFLDESGQRDYGPLTDRYYVVAAAIARVEHVDMYCTELAGLKRSFFGTPAVEVKSHWLRNPAHRKRHYLDAFAVSEARLAAFVESLYDWILATELVFIAGVVDKDQMSSQYTHPHYPSPVAYQVFLQRYQKFLASRHCIGAITFDEIAGSSPGGRSWQELLLRHQRRLKHVGCNYTGIQFTHVEDLLSFGNSASCPLIQIADIAAYNTFRQFRDHGSQWDDPAAKSLPVYRYFDRLLPRFHQSPSGVFAGFGVAKMPTRARHAWLA
jgi:hypothetical protein